MAYFFGFFGISFLDTNAMERSPSSFGLSLSHLDDQLYTSNSTSGSQRKGAGAGAGFAESPGKGGVDGGARFRTAVWVGCFLVVVATYIYAFSYWLLAKSCVLR